MENDGASDAWNMAAYGNDGASDAWNMAAYENDGTSDTLEDIRRTRKHTYEDPRRRNTQFQVQPH